MDRKQLEYFITVYDLRSMQAAADRLYVSRQGVSKMINQLEKELGHRLFLRTPKGLEPTDYAIALHPHVKQIMEEYAYISGMNFLAAQSKSVVTVYGLDHVLATLSPDFLAAFSKAHPDIIPSIVESTDEGALEGLSSGRCDLAIVTGPLDFSRFRGKKLFFAPYCVRLPKDHRLAEKGEITSPDLAGETIIGKGRSYACFRHNFDRYLLNPGIPVRILAETSDETVITALVARHLAISIGYSYTACLYPHPDVVERPFHDDKKGEYIYAAAGRDATLSSAAARFLDFLLAWCRSHRLPGTVPLSEEGLPD